MAAAADPRAQTGFYCSTSGTYFTDKESLNEHYKSDFHRYNLKRKVAGLPPVTHEWFEARKAQLAQTSSDATNKVWVDPLTKKKFSSENTYQAHVKSKKYQELVKKSGQPAPAAVIVIRKADEPAQQQQQVPVREQQAKQGFVIKPPSKILAAKQEAAAQADDRRNNMLEPAAASSKPRDKVAESDDDEAEKVADEAGWETASDDEAEQWEEWDLSTSLFDNHKAASMEASLEYMYKKFGFYLPDAEYLKDPQGLLRYLGAKLRYGHVPLYCSGDDPNVRQFPSLHAVQRHMVDTNQCKMLYDGNEDEYAEYYDYQDQVEEEAALVLAGAGSGALGGDTEGFELIVQNGEGSGAGKVLGSREFLKYYRQRHRPQDTRQSVLVNSMLQQYRRLAISTKEEGSDPLEVKQAKKAAKLKERSYLQLFMKSNIIRNLPKNCTY